MVGTSYPCYRIKTDVRGQWYWVYYGKDGDEISRSRESYVARADCLNDIKFNKGSANDPIFLSCSSFPGVGTVPTDTDGNPLDATSRPVETATHDDASHPAHQRHAV